MPDQRDSSPKPKRDTILPERLMRRVLEGVGEVVDRKLGRTVDPKSGLTTDQIIVRMNQRIDAKARNEKGQGRIAPHHLKLKIEWGRNPETPSEVTKRLDSKVLPAPTDNTNTIRNRTLPRVETETEVETLTTALP